MWLASRESGEPSRRRGRRWAWMAGVALIGAAAGPAVLATATPAGAAATLQATPSTGLVDGQTVTVTGSGFASNSLGGMLECNNTPNQPTIGVAGNDVPVSCTNPLSKIVNSGNGSINTTFTVHTGVLGPPASGTDSAGNDAATDAAKYPCPPTDAQIAAGASCVLAYGDQAGDQATAPIQFASPCDVPVTITTPAGALPQGSTGVAYSETLGSQGGKPPYAWSVISGGLPPGLSLNPSSGAITGTPTQASPDQAHPFTFTAQVADGCPIQHTNSKSFSIYVSDLGVPTVTVGASPASPEAQPGSVQLTVTVAGDGTAKHGIPTGSVTVGDEQFSSLCALSDLPGTTPDSVSCSTTQLFKGSHTITATYDGSSSYSSATGTLPYVVGSTPTVTLTPSQPSPLLSGKSLSLTATVGPPSGSSGLPVPTGSVTFTADGGATTLCTSKPLSSSATARCSFKTSELSLGKHQFEADYNGAASPVYFDTSSPPLPVAVKADPTVSLGITPASPTTPGTTLHLSSAIGAAVGGSVPTGTVKFHMGRHHIVVCKAPVHGGTASCTATARLKYSGVAYATYSGNAKYFPARSRGQAYKVAAG